MKIRDALIGHAQAATVLDRMVESRRVPAAVALAGPGGTGRRTAARALYAALNGRDVLNDPDLIDFWAVAEALGRGAPARGRDAATRREAPRVVVPAQIDAVRELKRALALDTFHPEGWRMVLVDDAETLSEPAANALLKIIEEPPPRTFFALVVAAPDLLLPTLRSRATVVRFGLLAEAEAVEVLLRSGLPAAEARRIAALAPGRPGRGIAIAAGEGPELRDAFLRAAEGRAPIEVPDRLDRAVAADAAALVVEAARRRLREESGGEKAAAAAEALAAALDAADDIERGAFVPLAFDAAAVRWAAGVS